MTTVIDVELSMIHIEEYRACIALQRSMLLKLQRGSPLYEVAEQLLSAMDQALILYFRQHELLLLAIVEQYDVEACLIN